MEGTTREEAERSGMIDTWLRKHRLIYTGATRHPFILSVRDCTVNISCFKTWLRFRNCYLLPELKEALSEPLVASVLNVMCESYDLIFPERKETAIFIISYQFILEILEDKLSHKSALGQDYIFVKEFVPFLASLLIKAWKESDERDGDVEIILGGIAALNDEISWFKKEASKWDIQLSEIVPQKSNQDYCRFMVSLMDPEVDYTIAITAFWAIEAVYHESFVYCLEEGAKIPSELQETCRRWGNDGFGHYCGSIKRIADRRLAKASSDVLKKAEVTLLRVLEHEVDFWNMSRGNA